MIAEAVVVFHGQVDPRQHAAFAVQRRVHIQCGAIAVPAAGTGLHGGKGFGLRLLGDNVHGAARIATAVQAGCGTFEHFNALDVGRVRGARVATVGAETVLVELRRGEAAHAVLVKRQAAEVVLLGHAAGKLQSTFHAGAAQVLEHRGRNHAD